MITTLLTWLNVVPSVVATLEWYNNRFQNYELKLEHRVLVEFE